MSAIADKPKQKKDVIPNVETSGHWNVLPGFATKRRAQASFADAKPGGESRDGKSWTSSRLSVDFSTSVLPAKFDYEFFGQLGSRTSGTASRTALVRPVSVIDLFGSQEQVIGIRTWRIVAFVQNTEPVRHRTAMQLPRKSVCQDQPLLPSEHAIAWLISASVPEPAVGSLFDATPVIHDGITHQCLGAVGTLDAAKSAPLTGSGSCRMHVEAGAAVQAITVGAGEACLEVAGAVAELAAARPDVRGGSAEGFSAVKAGDVLAGLSRMRGHRKASISGAGGGPLTRCRPQFIAPSFYGKGVRNAN